MDPKLINAWIDVLRGIITIAVTFIGGLWVWVKFVLERGLLPPSEMAVSVENLGVSGAATVIDCQVHIHNKGSSALVVTDLRIRIRYAEFDCPVGIVDVPPEAGPYGRLCFPHAQVLDGIGSSVRTWQVKNRDPVQLERGEFLIVPYDTFVQPGVNQIYSFVTALPSTAAFLLLRASFRYQLRPSRVQLALLGLARMLGMIQYSLHHIKEPHTVEKSFALRQEPQAPKIAKGPQR
jgi:hypothetical protein